MDGAFQRKLQAKLKEFKDWLRQKQFASVRLVQYCGVDMVGAITLLVADEALGQVEGLICEGFYVDWSQYDGRLYLRVWEFGGPEPSWSKVYAEESL